MKFKILIVKNGLNVDISDDIIKFKQYTESRTPYEVEFTYSSTNIDVDFESFGIYKMTEGKKVNMWGTKGTKSKLRTLLNIPAYTYHTVIFFYNLEGSNFVKTNNNNIGHWTFFNQIVQGTEFVEIATTKAWDKKDDVFRVLTHEIYHVWHNRAKRAGIVVEDTMDRYDKEFTIFASDGNRERNRKVLDPYWYIIATQPFLVQYLKVLLTLLKELKRKMLELSKNKSVPITNEPIKPKLKVEQMASAIKEYEGWFIGSHSYRNNNPGNLRWSKYQIGKDSTNFSIFKSYDDGWKALLFQLQVAIDGRSKYYKPEMTLIEFFSVYAPSSDNNYPVKYAEFVAKKLGVPANLRLIDLF